MKKDQYIRIEYLLSRYYDAVTTREEELELYLALVDVTEDSPFYPDALVLRTQWEGSIDTKKDTASIDLSKEFVRTRTGRSWLSWLSGAVAVLILALFIARLSQGNVSDKVDIESSMVQESVLFSPLGEEYNFANNPIIYRNELGIPYQLMSCHLWGWEKEYDASEGNDLYTALYQSTQLVRESGGEATFVVELSTGDRCAEAVVHGIRTIE